MRILLLSLVIMAAPAAAAPPADRPGMADELARTLNDPATAQKMTRIAQSLGKAMLDLPVGEVEAAIEGRKPTAADQRRTVRDVGRANNPDFERDLQRDLAASGAAIQSGMQAMAKALPSLMKSMTEAAREMEKGMANMPSPTYPKR
jgi:hypothetical protein